MNAITFIAAGPPSVLQLTTVPLPVISNDEVLIKVAAAGLNRADLMQRQGKYPPPPGASDILGMEVAGTIVATGSAVARWKIGDKVCALLAGGGYGEYAAAPGRHCLPVPENLSMIEAAALIEAVVTVYANLFETGGLQPGDTALVHGGASGIGTTAIQMVRYSGSSIIVTAGSERKIEACYDLGANFVVDYTIEDFVLAAKKATNNRGVSVVLDMVGGSYINRNLDALAFKGRHVSIATQSGSKAEVDIRLVMQKQLILTGSTLRGRDKAEKGRLIAEVEDKFWPGVAKGKIKPVIYQALPLKNAAEAHKVMESGAHIGKIVLEVS
jgi:NADPH2:quinone reductase